MRKITAILMISLMVLLILAIAGCKKPAQTQTTDEADSAGVEPFKELPETQQTTGTLNEAQEIESDIDDEGVKNLDKDLDEITW